MKAAVTDGKGNVGIEQVPDPVPNDYQCLCKIHACATCTGTDLKHLKNALPWQQEYPGLLGHESVGTVVQTGSKIRNIKIGDRYLRPAAAYAGEKLSKYNSMWGGFAEYGLVTDSAALLADNPDANVHPYVKFQQFLPQELDLDNADATMLVTLKEAASYVASAGIGLYKSVLILGSGAVGYSMLRFAKIFGADPVIMIGRRDQPLELARELGADAVLNCVKQDAWKSVRELTNGTGVDFIIDTTGSAEFLKTSMSVLAQDGKVAPYATYPRGTSASEEIDKKNLAPAATAEHLLHKYLLDAVRLKLIDPSMFYSHQLPFAEVEQGFEMLKNKEAFKIVFEID